MVNEEVVAEKSKVVEEVIHQDPLSCSEDVTKDVISQFLPQRKRKPRAKRPCPNKMIKLEQSPSSSNMMTTNTTMIGSVQNQSQDSIVETLAELEDTENENETELKTDDNDLNKTLLTPLTKSDKASSKFISSGIHFFFLMHCSFDFRIQGKISI